MAYKLITAPTTEPVALADAKLHLREDGTDQDARIEALISAARSLAEQKTGRAFAPQTWELVLDDFPQAFILHHPPVVGVESLKYIDADGVEQTVNPVCYTLDSEAMPGYLVPAYGYGWPAVRAVPNAVRVRYSCGHAIDDAALAALRMWMLLAVATWFKHAEAVSDGQLASLPRTYVDGLLDEYKVYA